LRVRFLSLDVIPKWSPGNVERQRQFDWQTLVLGLEQIPSGRSGAKSSRQSDGVEQIGLARPILADEGDDWRA